MRGLLTVKHTFLAVLFLGLFALTARNVTDPDVWWHLETGRYIAEHKSVPHVILFPTPVPESPGLPTSGLPTFCYTRLLRTVGFGGLIIVFPMVLLRGVLLAVPALRPPPLRGRRGQHSTPPGQPSRSGEYVLRFFLFF